MYSAVEFLIPPMFLSAFFRFLTFGFPVILLFSSSGKGEAAAPQTKGKAIERLPQWGSNLQYIGE